MTRFALLLALVAIPAGSGELHEHPHGVPAGRAASIPSMPPPSPSHLPRAKWPSSNMSAAQFDDQYAMDQDDDDDYATPDTMTERESDMY